MRASRHNGRKGKNGVYDVKHNDREFNVEHSEHIDAERAKQNVYWDCYQGYSFGESNREERMSFTQVESEYYYEHYWEHVQEQNRRNEEARHGERNRSVEDLLKNSKTCPEESLLQLGNIDRSVPASVLAKVVAEFFEEFERRYGSHVHILDWALHLDEGTPHVHERHVFDAKNRYGELCPQQEKALEELGFELPDPTKKKGKYNNWKMSFDAECRRLFLEIAQRNGDGGCGGADRERKFEGTAKVQAMDHRRGTKASEGSEESGGPLYGEFGEAVPGCGRADGSSGEGSVAESEMQGSSKGRNQATGKNFRQREACKTSEGDRCTEVREKNRTEKKEGGRVDIRGFIMTKEVRSIRGKSLIVLKQKDKRQKEVAIPLEENKIELSIP